MEISREAVGVSGVGVWNVQADAVTAPWLVADTGILAREAAGWRVVPPPPDVARMGGVGALGGCGDVRWAAGGQCSLARSANGGASWEPCWLDGAERLITCFAVSPRFGSDRAVLAGTAGAGVLRSTDGGRRWLLSNFGLQEFTILTLATAGDWLRREMVFAGTLDGVYRSIGGGRAWQPAGLEGLAVQTLGASRQFARTGLLMAGTEEAGLHRSTDGGRTWQPVGDEIGGTTTVNTLLCIATGDDEAWLAGTDDGTMWRSADAGQRWQLVHEAGRSILALAAGPDARLYAALGDGGLLISRDGGQQWQPGFGM